MQATTATFRNPENSTVFLVLTVGAVLVGAVATLYAVEYLPILAAVAMAVTGGLIWFGFAAFRRSRVEAGPTGIRVVNPGREEFILWEELDTCHGGRFLTIRATSGAEVQAWSVQNSNWSHLRDRHGYADHVAGQLLIIHAQRWPGGTPPDAAG